MLSSTIECLITAVYLIASCKYMWLYLVLIFEYSTCKLWSECFPTGCTMALLRLVWNWATRWRCSRIPKSYAVLRWGGSMKWHFKAWCVCASSSSYWANCFRDLRMLKLPGGEVTICRTWRFRTCVYQKNVQKVAWIKGLHSTEADFEPTF